MRRAILTLIVLSSLLAAGPAAAFEYAECAGEICRWEDYPIEYSIRDPLGVDLPEGETVGVIQAAIERWNYTRQTFCEPLEFSYQGRRSTNTPGAQDDHNVVFFETDKWTFGGQALAVTTLWFDAQGYLHEADVAFNAVNFNWTLGDSSQADDLFSVKPTLTHEAGHFWGLDHSAETFATMYAFYRPNIDADDLDADDIAAATELFCGQPLPADDAYEQNDSFFNVAVLDGRRELLDLRLFDGDYFKLELAADRRLKVTVADESAGRFKALELYDVQGNLLGRERCDGDCAQALGEAGPKRPVTLRIHGGFDSHAVETARYSVLLEEVVPGEEGELTDDDTGFDDDDDDNDRACGGCGVGDAGDGSIALALLLASWAWFFHVRRRGAGAA